MSLLDRIASSPLSIFSWCQRATRPYRKSHPRHRCAQQVYTKGVRAQLVVGKAGFGKETVKVRWTRPSFRMLRPSDPSATASVQRDSLPHGAEFSKREQGDRGAEGRDRESGYFLFFPIVRLRSFSLYRD